MTIKSLLERIRHETRNGIHYYLYNKSRAYRFVWNYLYDRRQAKAWKLLNQACDEAMMLLPSGIISYALDNVRIYGNEHPDDILALAAYLEDAIAKAKDWR